jgi:hypothetical protein
MSEDPTPIRPLALIAKGKTDAEIAAGLREEMSAVLGPVMAVADKGLADGFHFTFIIGTGPFGKHVIQTFKITKEF